jgi:O-antigen ligase
VLLPGTTGPDRELDLYGAGMRTVPLTRVDVAGLAIVVAGVGWTLASAAANPGSRSLPTVAVLLLAPGAVAAGRVAGRSLGGPSAPAALACLAGLLVGLGITLETPAAASAPLGYGNANGCLFGLIAIAVAGVLAVPGSVPSTARRGAVVLVASLVLCALTGSVGACAATLAGLGLAWGARWVRRPWAAIPAAAIVVVGLLGVTAALASGAGPAVPAADSVGVRVSLWRQAAELGREAPLTGVGPGRFGVEQTFTADTDLFRAHSASLQQLAEQGAPGLVVLLALGGWAAAALWAVRDDPLAPFGAAALAAVGLEATFDWVLSEPAVSLGLALVVGAATARGRARHGRP